MGLHRKTAGILACMMGMTSIPAMPQYEKMVYAAEHVQEKQSAIWKSKGTASNASMSNAISFVSFVPQEVPEWYRFHKMYDEKRVYSFTDRDGSIQYRIYGILLKGEEEEIGWYACSSSGKLQDREMIDLEEEYWKLAPYIYQHEEPTQEQRMKLRDMIKEKFLILEKVSEYGKNEDGSRYDVWKMSSGEEERFFFYGYPLNRKRGEAAKAQWYECDEQGKILSIVARPFALSARNGAVTCLEERVSRQGDSIQIYMKGRAETQRPHLDGIFLFQGAGWSCNANIANRDDWTTGHSYERKIGDSYRLMRVDYQYLIELGAYCSDNGGNNITYTEENPQAVIWDESYKDGKPDYSSSKKMIWAESVTWKGNYDYVYDDAEGGSNLFELEITVKNPIPQLSGFAMQLWNGDKNDSDPDSTGFGYEARGNHIFAGNIASEAVKAHVHTGDLVRIEPECEKTGSLNGICSMCQKNVNEVIQPLGHQAGQAVTEGGYQVVRCIRCQKELSRKANTYMVTFQPEGGTLEMTQKAITYQETYGVLPVPVRAGYHFEGWYTEANGGELISADTRYTVVGNQTLYAHWTKQIYTAVFNGNGGMDGKEISVGYMEKLGKLPDSSRLGYLFQGWYTQKIQGEKISDQTQMPLGGAAYYAQWKPITYKVHYTGNYASEGEMEESIFVYDEEKPLAKNLYKKTGYLFQGWKDEKGTIYQDGAMVCNLTAKQGEVLNFKAQWSPIHYHFVFHSGSGEGEEMGKQEHVYGTSLRLMPNQYTKRGYHFSEWSVNEDGTGDTFTDEKTILNYTTKHDEEIHLYAQWKPEEYQIVFDHNGGTCQIRQKKVLFDTAIGELPIPKKEHYQFDGWFLDGTETMFDSDTIYQEARDIKLTARWSLRIKDMGNDSHIRPGKDDEFGTEDDEYYFNGNDQKPMTEDDQRIYAGEDGKYGTKDDYIDQGDGSHIRAGEDEKFGTEDDEHYYNGEDQKPETEDDKKIYAGEDGKYGTKDDYIDQGDGSHIRAGEDGKFGTEDDEHYYNGEDQKPETEDDKKIYAGEDGKYGTKDDYIDQGDGSHIRAGEDEKFGTEDDEHYYNGEDQKPETEDDKKIYAGEDGKYGTKDDYIDQGDGSHIRAGEDEKFGTEDDEHYYNGEDQKPETEDDKKIYAGEDGKYGTKDDYIDQGDGSHIRAGEDGKFGTEDDEHYYNGEDQKPETEDDKKKEDQDSSDETNRPQGDGGSGNSSSGSSGGSGNSGSGNSGSGNSNGGSIVSGNNSSVIHSESRIGEWKQDAKGWWYQFADGTYPKNCWQYLKYGTQEDWYHFDEQGYMQVGWFRDVDEHWYHLHTVSDGTLGHMETGWFLDQDGLWYYLNPVSDGHKGAMSVGWREILDRWYYFNPVSNGTKGAMYSGTVTPDGYVVDEKGVWTGEKADIGKTILTGGWN